MLKRAIRCALAAVAVCAATLVAVPPTGHAVSAGTAVSERTGGTERATLWKYTHQCGTSYANCWEDRRLYRQAGWPVSDIYYRPPGTTCPGGCGAGYYFHYGYA